MRQRPKHHGKLEDVKPELFLVVVSESLKLHIFFYMNIFLVCFMKLLTKFLLDGELVAEVLNVIADIDIIGISIIVCLKGIKRLLKN